MLYAFSRGALALAAISLGVCNYLILKVLDERRGKRISALQVMLNPLMIDRLLLTDAGQRHHRRFLWFWCAGAGCMLLAMIFAAMAARG